MNTIRVVAAVIHEGNKIFATARGYGEYKGQFEAFGSGRGQMAERGGAAQCSVAAGRFGLIRQSWILLERL